MKTYVSLTNQLKESKLIDEKFEFMLNNLTLEEVIGLKLENASKVMNGKLYGYNLYRKFPEIIKEALIRFAVQHYPNYSVAARSLGIHKNVYVRLLKKYKIGVL